MDFFWKLKKYVIVLNDEMKTPSLKSL